MLSEMYRQALDCIANWPSRNYDEEVWEEVRIFSGFVVTAKSDRALHAVQWAQKIRLIDKSKGREIDSEIDALIKYCGGAGAL